MAELEVPDESHEALKLVLEYAFETDDECVLAIAGPVVVAELRELVRTNQASLEAVGAAPRDDWRAYVLDRVIEQLQSRINEWEAACRKSSWSGTRS